MSHFKEVCKHCGTTINQCRCPSKDKEIRWSVCGGCAKPDDRNVGPPSASALLGLKIAEIASTVEIYEKTNELYYDLLLQVSKKEPHETRHETAKRLIIEAQETPVFYCPQCHDWFTEEEVACESNNR